MVGPQLSSSSVPSSAPAPSSGGGQRRGHAVTSEDRWDKALESLNENDKLQLQVSPDRKDYLVIVNEVLSIAAEKKRLCIDKAWKFKRRDGKVVIIRDLFEKIVVWVQKFKEVGDVAVSYDPGHAALPWAAVRFLLTIAIEDTQTFGAMVEGIEKVAMLVARCAVLEQLYLKPGSSDDTGIEQALVGLYVAILKFECNAIRFYGRNTAKRILSGVVPSSERSVEENLKKIAEAQAAVDYCAKLIDARHQRETGQKVVILGDAINGTHTKLDTVIADLQNLPILAENQKRLEMIMEQLEAPIIRSASILQDYEDSMHEREREELLQWLSSVPYQKHHKLKRKEYLKDSCGWLLSSREYIEWKKSSTSSILWLRGIAGSGKSVLVSSVIEDLHHEQSGNPNAAPIAYFYCSRDSAEPERASPEEIMRSILEQVASNTPELPIREPVVEVYKQKKKESRGRLQEERLTVDETIDILLRIFEENPVTIVIDALDECDPTERHMLLSALDTIITDSASLVRVFVSSRNDGDIVCQLEKSPNIFIQASDNSADIARYVQGQVSEAIRRKRMVRGNVSPEMKERIINTLISGAQGMFRWVSLQIQQLCDNRRVKHEGDILTELDHLPTTLQESYEVIYKDILAMANASQKLAIKTMQTLFCAQRRLTAAEMLAAVTVDPLSGDALISSEADIVDVCCNMVLLDEEVGSFRFAHLSVREYLKGRSDYAPQIPHGYVMDRCLSVFLCECGDIRPSSSNLQFVRQQNETFHRYAATYWPSHCQLGLAEVETSLNLERFIGRNGASSNPFEKWINSCIDLQKSRWELNSDVAAKGIELEPYELRKFLALSITAPPSILFVSCLYGLGPVIRYLLPRERINWNQIDHSPIARWFLSEFKFPLGLASGQGYTDIVEMLVHWQKGFYETGMEGAEAGSKALLAAVTGSQFATAKLLLESGVDKNALSKFGKFIENGPLSMACQRGNEEMVELLLSHDADPNICRYQSVLRSSMFYCTPLYDACAAGHHRVTKLLVEAGADLESTVSGSIMHYASDYGDEYLVETLLARGVDVHAPECGRASSQKKTPLHKAAENGHVGIIKLLVKNGVEVNAEDSEGKRAIYYAAEENRAAAVDAFIALGVDMCEKDRSGMTILHAAAQQLSGNVVRLLVAKGVDIEEVNGNGWTLLHFAASRPFYRYRPGDTAVRVIQFLLDHGAPVDAKDSKGRTALSNAARNLNYRLVKLLVARGADMESQDCDGKTPLDFARAERIRVGQRCEKQEVIDFLSKPLRDTGDKDNIPRSALS